MKMIDGHHSRIGRYFGIAHKSDDNYPLTAHSHVGYEIVWLLEGEAQFILDDQFYTLMPGHMLIFKGFIMHKVRLPEKVRYVRRIIHFHPDFVPLWDNEQLQLGRILDQPGKQAHLIWLNDELARACCGLFDRLLDEFGSEGRWGWETAIQLALQELLVLLAREVRSEQGVEEYHPQTDKERLLKAILGRLNKGWKEGCRLDDLAGELFLSKYYLCHFFKEEMGVTLQQYVVRKKITEAKKLLVLTEWPVKEVCYQVGYQTTSHFIKSFKQVTGVTPEHFRRTSRDSRE
ncbi:helix-turn-helix transcriptional regulator [Paenibacillus aceris]|uniref:AraC-like DNA-binding protein n=1 Tax=Paenibacillus aceris TaxID=869555 RepID=A0ABS4I3I8_9BACL|nr:AraC family transcriptional regulator [Paenibacillus aceris]MBP1965363.1 AraC-like DNA-binding protein [Paenibacillus aceris]NHW36045.1 AraC family transcriptional regulator [Paenibacillus aceris]